eukprot:scaffold150183_cov21-Tisochrysis_lutea.AAC.2
MGASAAFRQPGLPPVRFTPKRQLDQVLLSKLSKHCAVIQQDTQEQPVAGCTWKFPDIYRVGKVVLRVIE